MSRGFQFPSRSDLWVLGRNRGAVPMSLISQVTRTDWVHERDAHFIRVIGRLKPGVTISQAQSDIAAITRRLEQDFPKSNAGLGSNVMPLHAQVVGDVRSMLFILLGAVGFVLLIACTNVANLMLARATQRDREIAIRAAVGASRLRLIRQLLTESLLLSIVGGLAGLLVSIWAVAVFVKLSPGDIPRLSEASVDFRLLGFTLLVSLLTGLGFGLLPAFQATRTNLNTSLKEGGTKASEGRQRRGARNILVGTEIALAQVLLVGAALLAISYVRVTEINPGFNPDRVLTAKIAPSNKKYPDSRSRATYYTTVLEHLQSLPGVESAGMVMNLPLTGSSMNRGFRVEGRPIPKADENVTMDFQIVSPNYFSTLEIPIKRGRGLHPTDVETTEPVIVINETMARQYWPNEDPVGNRLGIGESTKDTSWRTIVGVVSDSRHACLSELPVPTAFIAYRQDLESWPRMGFVIRAKTDAASLTSAIRKELAEIDRAHPVYAIEPMETLLRTSGARRRSIPWSRCATNEFEISDRRSEILDLKRQEVNMESLFTDIRFSFRSLVNQPGFTLVAILTLALGIGANTAIFSVVNAVLLRPLPFKDSGRVVMIWNNGAEAAGGDRTPLAVADLQDVRSQSRSFESFGAFQNGTFNYPSGEVPEQLRGLGVTANLLSLLGAVPQIGRDFQTADEQVGAERTILISDRFWHSHFGADKQVVGRRVNLSGISTTIIGVMPAVPDFPGRGIGFVRVELVS